MKWRTTYGRRTDDGVKCSPRPVGFAAGNKTSAMIWLISRGIHRNKWKAFHWSVTGIHGLPALLFPQLGRARHLQEEVLAHQGPASGVRDEGEEIIINCGDFSEKLTPHAHCTRWHESTVGVAPVDSYIGVLQKTLSEEPRVPLKSFLEMLRMISISSWYDRGFPR